MFNNLKQHFQHRPHNSIVQTTPAELGLKLEIDFIIAQLRQLSVTLTLEIYTRIAQTVSGHQHGLNIVLSAQKQAALTKHAAQRAVSAATHIHQQVQQIA